MRNEGTGAAGVVSSTDKAPVTLSKAQLVVAQAQAPGKATDAFPLPSPDKVVVLKPGPLGGGLEATAYRLPENATFDVIKLVEIDGQKVLALLQPDGTVLVLEGTGPASGSSTPDVEQVPLPNLLIGDVEVPREALAAAFQANGIQPAAGGDQIASSGANFDEIVPDIGDGLGIQGLLPPTELGFAGIDNREFTPGDANNGLNNGLNGLVSGLIGPTIISGTIGGGGGGGDGGGNESTPGVGSGFARLSEAFTDDGTLPDAGARVQTLSVVVDPGSATTTVRFGSVDGLTPDSNGPDGGGQIRWVRVDDTHIEGYVDTNPDAEVTSDVLAITVVLQTTTIETGAPGTVSVVVTLLAGFAEPSQSVNGLPFDLGQIQLIASNGVGPDATGSIGLQVLDDQPIAALEIAQGEGDAPFGIVHDETAGAQGAFDQEGEVPADLQATIAGLANAPAGAPLGWAINDALGEMLITSGAKIGADNYASSATPSIAYSLTTAAGDAFAGADSGLKVTGGGSIFLYTETANGHTVVVGREGGEGASPNGKIAFVLSLGTGNSLSLVQFAPIDHSAPQGSETSPDTSETVGGSLGDLIHITQTVTDGDGDVAKATASLPLTIAFADDGPTVDGEAKPVGGEVREDGLGHGESMDYSVGNAETPADFAGTSDEIAGVAGSLTALFTSGVDTPLTISLAEDASKLPSLTSNGVAVTYLFTSTGTGTILVASAGDHPVFTLTVNKDGSWSFDLQAQLDHVAGEDTNTALQSGDGSISGLDFSGLIVATDGDGDSVTAGANTFVITVRDDVPTPVSEYNPIVVDIDESGLDTGLSTGNPDGDPLRDGEVAGNGETVSSFSGSLQDIVKVGADTNPGGATFGLNTSLFQAGPVLSGLTSLGAAVMLSLSEDGHTLRGLVGNPDEGSGREVFTFALNADGTFTFTLKDQIDHPSLDGEAVGDNSENTLAFDLSGYISATDGDQDPLVLPANAVVINLQDDVPVLVHDDEEGIPLANYGEGGPNDGAPYEALSGAFQVDEKNLGDHSAVITDSLQRFVNVGADEVVFGGELAGEGARFTLKAPGDPVASGLTSDGQDVMIRAVVDGQGQVTGLAGYTGSGEGEKAIFSFSLTEQGTFTFELLAHVDHPQGYGENALLTRLDLSQFIEASDFDGDAITLANGMFTIQVIDDIPTQADGSELISVDESGLPGANADGEVGLTVVTGSIAHLATAGADGPLTFGVQTFGDDRDLTGLQSQGVDVRVVEENGALVGKAGDTDVFRFAVGADGQYTFTLLAQVDHPTGDQQNELTFDLSKFIVARDTDGDVLELNSGVQVTVLDDLPLADVGTVIIKVDESGLDNDQSTGNLDGVPLRDGETQGDGIVTMSGTLEGLVKIGADKGISYGIDSAAIGDGVTLAGVTSMGKDITLTAAGDVLTGSADGRTVFTFTLGAAGAYVFSLVDQIDHPNLNGEEGDNTENSTTLDLSAYVTAQDFDGDPVALPASAIVIEIQDDIPVLVHDDEEGIIDAVYGNPDVPPADHGDEDEDEGEHEDEDEHEDASQHGHHGHHGHDGHDDDEGHDDEHGGSASSGTIGGNGPGYTAYAGTIQVTETGIADQSAIAIGSLQRFVDVGADEFAFEDGSVSRGASFSLIVPVDPVASGLTSGGINVMIRSEDGGLFGYTGSGATEKAVFTFSVDAQGTYTFQLLGNLDHPKGYGDNELATRLDLSKFIQASDYDGDVITFANGMFTVQVVDDVPTQVEGTESGAVDESALPCANDDGEVGSVSATGTLAGLVSVGADGAGGVARFYATIGANDDGRIEQTSGGQPITVVKDGDMLVGKDAGGQKVFSLTVAVDGSYEFKLLGPIDHAAGDGQNEASIDLSRFIVALDTDGDAVRLQTGAFTIAVKDDVPLVSSKTVVGEVEEDGLTASIGDATTGNKGPNDDQTSDETGTTGQHEGQTPGRLTNLFLAGADGPVTLALKTELADDDLPRLLSRGVEVSYHSDGSVLTGTANGVSVFTLTVNPNGTWTFDLNAPLDHVDGKGENEDLKTVDGAPISAIDFSAILIAMDADGDVVEGASTGAFKLIVEDDIPEIKGALVANVAEDGLTGLSTGNPDAGKTNATVATGSLASLVSPGADSPVKFEFRPNTSALPSLKSQGETISYAIVGSMLVGFVNNASTAATYQEGSDRTVFKFSLTTGGSYTFTLLDQIDHGVSSAGDAQTLALDLSPVIKVTDSDLDVVSFPNGTFKVQIEDDVPVFVKAEAVVSSNSVFGVAETGAITFKVGADEPGSITRFAAQAAPAGLTSGGQAVKYLVSSDGKTITGYVDLDSNKSQISTNEKIFTAQLTGDTYAFTQYKGLDLPKAATVTTSSGSYGSGPSDYKTIGSTTEALAIISGYEVKSGFKASTWNTDYNLEEKDINSSGAGFGVKNNQFESKEFIRVDFDDKDFRGPSNFDGPTVNAATFQFQGFKSGDVVHYVATYDDGSKQKSTVDFSSSTFTIGAAGGKAIDYVEFYDEKGSGKLDLLSVAKSGAAGSVGLEFEVTKSDFDGDKASGSVSVTVTGDTILEASGSGNATLTATSKDTVIMGHGGADILTGGDGDDILIGNLGVDKLTGGKGADTFKLTDLSAHDLIADYKAGEDRIDLTGLFSTGTNGPAPQVLDFVKYDAGTGQLSVDTDGANPAAAPVVVAIVESHPATLTIVYDDQSHAHQTATING